MRKSLFLIMAGTLSCFGIEWNKAEIEGVEYVPLEQVGEFYHLAVTDEATLKNKELTMKFEKGAKYCSLNKVNFELSHPLVAKNDGFFLATKDLIHILEPVLRPSKIDGLKGCDTILLDLVVDESDRKMIRGSLREMLLKRDFKVIDPNREEKAAGAVEEGAVFLQIVVEKGAEKSLRTSVVGTEQKAGMAIATPLHWSLIQQKKLNLQDRRISLSDGDDLEDLAHPGVRLVVTLESDWNAGAGEPTREFCSQMGKEIGKALSLAKMVGAKRELAAKEEK